MRKTVPGKQQAVLLRKQEPARPTSVSSPEEAPSRLTPVSVVEFARSLSPSSAKLIEHVTLTQSQYPSCANIHITLVEALASKMVSPLIVVEGESKVFRNKAKAAEAFNKKGADAFFLRVRPSIASPMLYQLLECVYTNLRGGTRAPASMCLSTLDTMEERTFKNGFLYINKLQAGIVEYTGSDCAPRVVAMLRELETLAAREPQMAKVVLAPIVLYRGSGEYKVTFALKRISMESMVHATVVDASGEHVRLVMTESADDDERLAALGVMDTALELEDELADQDPLFNV
nr:MAG: MC046L [Molluscum contagiosum virus]